MPKTKFLARDITIEINTGEGSGEDADWTPIGGLVDLTHSPSTTRATTTDRDSGGRPSHMVAERGDEWTLNGLAIEDVATGERDAGQAAVETLGKAMGLTSLGQFRITSPGDNTITFYASAEVTLPSGGLNDAAAWGAKLTVSDEVEYA